MQRRRKRRRGDRKRPAGREAGREERGRTDGGPSTAGPEEEENDEDHAESASDDVRYIGEGAVVAYLSDTAFWVDTDGCSGGICGAALEDRAVMMLELAGAAVSRCEERGECVGVPGGRRDCTRDRKELGGRGARSRQSASSRQSARCTERHSLIRGGENSKRAYPGTGRKEKRRVCALHEATASAPNQLPSNKFPTFAASHRFQPCPSTSLSGALWDGSGR